jgi:riboflavin kinase/FMN adenylyltransferase|tara:strand:- start:2159 stop:3088 length:930 start_codon:yes stop_codon:yes gene_type:complete
MSNLIHLDDIKYVTDTVVTVGTFDGVHQGHRALIEAVAIRAKATRSRSVVVTFDPHPRSIISTKSQGIKLLTTLQERAEIIEDMGIDAMCVIPFTRDFSLLNSEQFVQDVVHRKIGIRHFVIGYDHHFGKDRSGTIYTLERLAPRLGFDVQLISKKEMGDTTISSTLIRKEIQVNGNMKRAAILLGREYILNGVVVHGDERGREIGYPTANLKPEHEDKAIPKNGIYAVRVRVGQEWFGGMMNIGVRPTFEGSTKALEVHIFDFNSMIYGQTVQVRFIDRIRDERKFTDANQLKNQLHRDKQDALNLLS